MELIQASNQSKPTVAGVREIVKNMLDLTNTHPSLDTLNEISNALQNNPDIIKTILDHIEINKHGRLISSSRSSFLSKKEIIS